MPRLLRNASADATGPLLAVLFVPFVQQQLRADNVFFFKDNVFRAVFVQSRRFLDLVSASQGLPTGSKVLSRSPHFGQLASMFEQRDRSDIRVGQQPAETLAKRRLLAKRS